MAPHEDHRTPASPHALVHLPPPLMPSPRPPPPPLQASWTPPRCPGLMDPFPRPPRSGPTQAVNVSCPLFVCAGTHVANPRAVLWGRVGSRQPRRPVCRRHGLRKSRCSCRSRLRARRPWQRGGQGQRQGEGQRGRPGPKAGGCDGVLRAHGRDRAERHLRSEAASGKGDVQSCL